MAGSGPIRSHKAPTSDKSWRGPFLLVLVLLLAPACEASQPSQTQPSPSVAGDYAIEERPELGKHFAGAGVDGTFVLLDPRQKKIVAYDLERGRTGFLPASTYKIPHALIALETGVVDGPEFAIQWDASEHPRQQWWPEVWAKDQTLSTALPNSVIWYFQEVAKRVGEDRMEAYLNRFDYGNRSVSGGIDQFWLTGGLRTSATEQVEFLQRFHDGKLDISDESMKVVKDLLILEETPEYRLSGKSGWVGLGEEGVRQIGWQVGYVERQGLVHFFALNIDIEKPEDASARLRITKDILSELGVTTSGQ